MSTFITVVSAVLVFGFLIFIHEFGHYIFARIFHVKINEFSIGMGPRLLSYDSKKTGIKYTLAAIPIGGFVAMAGEDDESDDPDSFDKKPAWQRFIITVAGASVNIIFGFLAMIILTCLIKIGGTTIGEFVDRAETGYDVSTEDSGLKLGDTILEIEGKPTRIADELSYEVMRYGNEPVDVLVLRDGKEILVPDVRFPVLEEQGQVFGTLDFKVYSEEKTFGRVLSYSFAKSWLTVRMTWESIIDLIRGRYTFAAVSGPVGISSAIGDAASAGFAPFLYVVVVISINLGVMNLLPIPALDGGRLLTVAIEMITRRRMPKKVEGAINAVGLAVLLGLSAIILVKDVIQLIV